MRKSNQLSPFDQTVIDITQQAATPEEAILYVMDWLQDKDTRCTRTDAARYIAQARQADAALNATQG